MKKIVQTCNRSGPCYCLSNLLVNTVRFVIFTLHRVSDTKALMLAVYADINLFNWPDANFIQKAPSHGHGCNFIRVRSGPFQKAGREREGVWKI